MSSTFFLFVVSLHTFNEACAVVDECRSVAISGGSGVSSAMAGLAPLPGLLYENVILNMEQFLGTVCWRSEGLTSYLEANQIFWVLIPVFF